MIVLGFLLLSGALVRAERRIVDNYVVHIENGVLSRVEPTNKSSDHLDLSNLDLLKIDVDCFKGVTGLKNLSLAGNYFTHKLPYLVFSPLADLEHLSLANSKVTKLEWLFQGLEKLGSLDLRDNGIKTFSKGSFYGLSNTTDIFVSDNNATAVTPDHFQKPFPLLRLCTIKGIVHWVELFNGRSDQKNCTITYQALINRTIDLHGEGIEGFEKGWFRIGDSRVHALNFARNNIQSLTSNMINDLPRSVKNVDLSWNHIRSVNRGVIKNENLHKLEMRGNPITLIESYAFAETGITDLGIPLEFIETLPGSLYSLIMYGKVGNLQYQCTNKRSYYSPLN